MAKFPFGGGSLTGKPTCDDNCGRGFDEDALALELHSVAAAVPVPGLRACTSKQCNGDSDSDKATSSRQGQDGVGSPWS